MPRFDTSSLGHTFGQDGLRYTGSWQRRTLWLRRMTLWQAVWWAGLRAALDPPHARPLMARGMRGWEPLGDRKSITGAVQLEIDGPLTQGDLDQLTRVLAEHGEAA